MMSGMAIRRFKVEIKPRDESASLWVYYDGEMIGLVACEDGQDYVVNYSLTIAECRALALGISAVADVAERDGYVPISER